MTLESWMLQPIWATAASVVANAGAGSMSAPVLFNYLEFPTDIVFQVVVFRLLFRLSLRDLVRMFLMRGYEFTHETVREWEERLRRCWPSTCGASVRESRKLVVRRASLQRFPQPTNRTGSSRGETAILPNAGLRCFPLGAAFLSSVRGDAAVLSSEAHGGTPEDQAGRLLQGISVSRLSQQGGQQDKVIHDTVTYMIQ
jgi:hypothetical protein